MTPYPFEVVYDAPQHNVLGVTFDNPMPWTEWERENIDGRIAAAVRREEDPESPTSISNIGIEIEELRFALKKGNPQILIDAAQAAVERYDEWVEEDE